MSDYPHPLPLPENVSQSRLQRDKQVIRAATLGIKLRIIIIVFELIGVWWMQSYALFLDAVSTTLDVVSSLFLIYCMKLAQKPPDYDHPFGHGRYEPLGGFLLGALLTVSGFILCANQIFNRMHYTNTYESHSLGWLFPAITLVLLDIFYRYIQSVAKKEHSPALSADAIHYRVDGLTSLFATIALVFAAYMPSWADTADQIGGLMISLFMICVGIYTTRENVHQLMDRVPDVKFFTRVRNAALQVEGIQETEKIRIQQYGPDAHVDIDIEVSPDLSVCQAHILAQKVRVEIQKEWPSVRDVTVHVEPYYANDH